MKRKIFSSVLALVAVVFATSCSSTSYMASSANSQDDLYSTHDKSAIERQLMAENQKLKAQIAAERQRSEAFQLAAEAIESRESSGITLTDIDYSDVTSGSVNQSSNGATNVTIVVEPKYSAALYGNWAVATLDNPWYYDWNDRWLYNNFYYRPYWSSRDWRYFYGWNSYCYYNPHYYYSHYYRPRPYYPSYYYPGYRPNRPNYNHYVRRDNVKYGRPYISGNSYSSNNRYNSNTRNPINSTNSSGSYRRLSTSNRVNSSSSTRVDRPTVNTTNNGVYRRPTSSTHYRDAVNDTRSNTTTVNKTNKKTTKNSGSYRRSTSNSSSKRTNYSSPRSTNSYRSNYNSSSSNSTRSNTTSTHNNSSSSRSNGGTYRR